MNILNVKKIAFGLALTATANSAKAQKVYTEGTINYSIEFGGTTTDTKTFFKGDTSSLSMQRGPAEIKMIGTTTGDYFVVLVSVPVASMKKAAVATPAEMEEAASLDPQYAFTKTTETKKIGDFNCLKYQSKDVKSGKVYDLWITNDIKVPANTLTKLYTSLGGTPIMFTYLQGGTDKGAQVVTLKSIVDSKVPAGSFKVPSDYDKISLTDLQSMGRKQ
jgi:hypothetical protein